MIISNAELKARLRCKIASAKCESCKEIYQKELDNLLNRLNAKDGMEENK